MDVLINGEILLFGTVGGQFLPDVSFFTDIDVATALASIGGRDVKVKINSGGGFADQGVAIFNLLKAHTGKVDVSVEGVAASAASVIAMAGDSIIMKTGTTMMIHKAQSFSIGNVADHQKTIESLNATDNAMADIYAARTGRPRADILAEMTSETWMTGEDAVAKKYATGLEAEPSMRAAAFDYRLYTKAPERMVALAAMLAGDWTPPPAPPNPAAKFWKFIGTHDKAVAALASSFQAQFNGETIASHQTFTEIWDAAQRGEAAADWTPSQRQFVEIDAAWAVQAESIRREMANVAATCGLMGKPERITAFIKSGSSQKAAYAALQAEKVAAADAGMLNNHSSGSTIDSGGGAVDHAKQAASNAAWAVVIERYNKTVDANRGNHLVSR